MCGSTCFGRFLAHHQELTSALTASGFTLERGGSSVVGRGLPDLAHHQELTTALAASGFTVGAWW